MVAFEKFGWLTISAIAGAGIAILVTYKIAASKKKNRISSSAAGPSPSAGGVAGACATQSSYAQLIGNTPLIKLNQLSLITKCDIFVKVYMTIFDF